ncbi:hypothetical protein G6F68_012498 [Rhizopus microsporus]|nr:hypothetical protein G6F68_012498 [Rhizopus microsporus]
MPDRADRGAAAPLMAGLSQPLQRRIVTAFDDVVQQCPPALQEHCAVVELDRQQVVLVEALLDGQQVADLPRTGPKVITTMANAGQCLAVEHAAVGGPQAMAGWINQCRCGVAADRPGRAVLVAGGVEAGRCTTGAAVWTGADQAPGDASAAVADHQGLCGDASLVGEVQGGFQIAGTGQVTEVQAHRTRQLRDPAQGIAAAIGMRVQDGAPGAFAHREHHVGLAGHCDALVMHGDRSIGRQRARCCRRSPPAGRAARNR